MRTDYKRLKNRCPHCGHRLDMTAALSRHCTVVMGFRENDGPETVVHCPCRTHVRP